MQNNLIVDSRPYALIDITDRVNNCLKSSSTDAGTCNIFTKHTSCSLTISENCDPTVLLDLEDFMKNLVPENHPYRHNAEGSDDMPAHIRSVLTQTSLSIPYKNQQLLLGTWQAVYLWEHRAHKHKRELIISS